MGSRPLRLWERWAKRDEVGFGETVGRPAERGVENHVVVAIEALAPDESQQHRRRRP